MDAADVLYGVTMGDDGVTKVVSRRLPREAQASGYDADSSVDGSPPPFAGVAAAEVEEPPRDEIGGVLGESPATGASPRDEAPRDGALEGTTSGDAEAA